MRSCNRVEEGICAKKKKNLFLISRRERSEGVYLRANKKGMSKSSQTALVFFVGKKNGKKRTI